MLGDLYIYMLAVVLLCMPLVFWLYVFTEFFHYGISRYQFILGIIIGAIPVMFFSSGGQEKGGVFLGNIFESIAQRSTVFTLDNILFFAGFFAFLWAVSYGIQVGISRKKEVYKKYLCSYSYMIGVLIIALISISIFQIGFYETSSVSTNFGSIVFYTFGSIVGYYLVVALLEEGIKFISGYSFYSEKAKIYIQQLFSIGACVALGFAWSENILYTLNFIALTDGTQGLLSLVFFRSIFSVVLHIFASLLMLLAFYTVLFREGGYIKKMIVFSVFILFSLFAHAMYDVALTFGYLWVIFIYTFATYFLITYMAFKREL